MAAMLSYLSARRRSHPGNGRKWIIFLWNRPKAKEKTNKFVSQITAALRILDYIRDGRAAVFLPLAGKILRGGAT